MSWLLTLKVSFSVIYKRVVVGLIWFTFPGHAGRTGRLGLGKEEWTVGFRKRDTRDTIPGLLGESPFILLATVVALSS